MNEYIRFIKDAGYRVFIRPGQSTYCFFTDGVRIAYAQWGSRNSVSSVHKPNLTTGTGFSFADEITVASLRAAIACHAPYWASSNDRKSVIKYRDFAAFLAESKFNSELIEV